MLSHEETKRIFVIHKASDGHYNKKIDYEKQQKQAKSKN